MPIYITDSRVDWDWPRRTESERAIIRRYQPRLDESNHGIESFSALLEAASRELPFEIVAVIDEDDADEPTLLVAREGRVAVVTARTSAQDADVERLLATDKAELFPVSVPWRERVVGAERERFEHALYFPEPMLDEIQDEATRLDKSMSWIVQKAWVLTREVIARTPDRDAAAALRSEPVVSTKRRQTLYYPGEMLVEMEAEATRFDSSMSWVMQLALELSRPAIAALPDATEFPCEEDEIA